MEEKCSAVLAHLCNKYESNPYILQRLEYHIQALESVLDNEEKNHEKRIDRTNMLTYEQQIFMQVFLSKNHYFYLANVNCFYEYDGKHYTVVKEDDILYKLLTTISQDKTLIQWKYKTKTNIIKQIKGRSLLTCIPETETIQNVLNFLYPAFFSTKDQVKYFLTVLGDNILKKKQENIYLLYGKSKKILMEIDNVAYITIGNTNAIHNFMTKYHENHQYENCRLLHMVDNSSVVVDLHIGLDMLCVAAHYSTRYENGDNYIATKAGEELKKYTFFLKNNASPNPIVDVFCNERITVAQNDVQIKWKHMHFLWKQYITGLTLPSMIYTNALKQILKTRFEYNEETDSFLNVTSKYLPLVSDFIKFWEQTVVENVDSELELDEICLLFKTSSTCISEIEVLKILKHFFPMVEIVEDKYVLNVSCNKWDKWQDISLALDQLREEYKQNQNLMLISFDDAYIFYCSKYSGKWIVSKHYFEKYLYIHLEKFIVFDTFISSDWYLMEN